jgi:hypothetical protein
MTESNIAGLITALYFLGILFIFYKMVKNR